MQQDYLVYVHEKDCYDFYMLHDVIRTASRYFIIDFEEAAEALLFLNAVQDGLYPRLIVIDLYDEGQVQSIISKLHWLQPGSFIPVWLLADVLPEKTLYVNSLLIERPQHRESWEALAHRIIKYIAEP